jgi:hypothetical protein
MSAIRISGGAALCALLAIPAACSSDSNGGNGSPEAGTGAETGNGGDGGGSGGSGGKGGTGGKGATGATGGSTAGAGGVGAGGEKGDAQAGAGGKAQGGSDSGVPDSSTTVPDGGNGEPDATPDGATGGCMGAPAKSTDAKLCLTFTPQAITVVPTDAALDGKGTLLINVFDTQPGPTTVPLKTIFYPGPPSSGMQVSVDAIPPIAIDGLPATAYLRVLFVDNIAFFGNPSTLTYGMFVGGFDLTKGVIPPPPALRQLTLDTGVATSKEVLLTALRKFTTKVTLALFQGMALADDGQGPISLGAFDVAAPANHPVFGGVQLPCTDLKTKGSIDNVTGFFYGEPGDYYFGGQLDDFNQGGLSKPGSVVSLGGGANGQSIIEAQKITLAAGQYAVTIPEISLNVVLPGSTGFTPYACPVAPTGDAGPDAN